MSVREWRRGAELPSLSIWWTDNDHVLINMATADSFEGRLGKVGCPALLVKSAGITGAVGAGVEPTGTPNVTVEWDSGDLDIEPGAYTLLLIASFSGKERMMACTVNIADVVEEAAS